MSGINYQTWKGIRGKYIWKVRKAKPKRDLLKLPDCGHNQNHVEFEGFSGTGNKQVAYFKIDYKNEKGDNTKW